jgi:DNA polymerase III epsilon subunit-like protein
MSLHTPWRAVSCAACVALATPWAVPVVAAEVPAFVRAADEAPVTGSDPAADPAAWRLAIIDVETTGLVPGYHEMIDLGLVMTDLDGVPIDSLFMRIQPRHPERLSPGAARVNDFDAARWKREGALTPAAAAESLFRFHRRVAAGHHVLMVAWNCQFDAAFLDHLLRESGHSWRELYHYFVLDLPSMAWSIGERQLTNGALAERFGVPDEPRVAREHTGLTGAQLNARIYRAMRLHGAAAPAQGDVGDGP